LLKLGMLAATLSIIYSALELARYIYMCIKAGFQPQWMLIAELIWVLYGAVFFMAYGIYRAFFTTSIIPCS
jgi:hypothetical protein